MACFSLALVVKVNPNNLMVFRVLTMSASGTECRRCSGDKHVPKLYSKMTFTQMEKASIIKVLQLAPTMPRIL